ncbi:MAG: TetR family transcriptional regulator [Thermoleophilia bacterium]|nr:TetR family transcriptional regulator [Thermoleophilia bacterium]
MSSTGDKAIKERRPHDAQASRQALLAAARTVFDEVGYERATTREIGERAGVDPALIARYFESKEGLFMAAIADLSVPAETQVDFEPAALVATLLERWDERGHSPISRALASPSLTDEVRRQVSGVLRERLLKGEVELLRGRGVPEPELRAELLIALAVGIAMTRANGTLEALAAASREDVMAVLAPLVDALGSA